MMYLMLSLSLFALFMMESLLQWQLKYHFQFRIIYTKGVSLLLLCLLFIYLIDIWLSWCQAAGVKVQFSWEASWLEKED